MCIQCGEVLFPSGVYFAKCPLCRRDWQRVIDNEWGGHAINRSYTKSLDCIEKTLPNGNFRLIGMFGKKQLKNSMAAKPFIKSTKEPMPVVPTITNASASAPSTSTAPIDEIEIDEYDYYLQYESGEDESGFYDSGLFEDE